MSDHSSQFIIDGLGGIALSGVLITIRGLVAVLCVCVTRHVLHRFVNTGVLRVAVEAGSPEKRSDIINRELHYSVSR